MHKKLNIIILYLLVSVSCNLTQSSEKKSFFLSLKDSFPKKHLNIFELNSKELDTTYRSSPRINHPKIDSILDSGTTYLYSWQNSRSPDLIEFTTLTEDEYRGFSLTYFITDKKDKIISVTTVASLNGEGGVSYESTSKFSKIDTLYKISAISTSLDIKGIPPYKKLKKSMGDSTFYKIVIDSLGRVKEFIINKKKELNY